MLESSLLYKTNSVRSLIQMVQPIVCGSMFTAMDKRHERGGNSWIDLGSFVNSWGSFLARVCFFRCSQLHTHVFHQCDFHAVSMCLSNALMETGNQSVPWQNLAGLGTIGRVAVAACFRDDAQSVSRCTNPDPRTGPWATPAPP